MFNFICYILLFVYFIAKSKYLSINDLTGTGATFMSPDGVHANTLGEIVMEKYMVVKLNNILHFRK